MDLKAGFLFFKYSIFVVCFDNHFQPVLNVSYKVLSNTVSPKFFEAKSNDWLLTKL